MKYPSIYEPKSFGAPEPIWIRAPRIPSVLVCPHKDFAKKALRKGALVQLKAYRRHWLARHNTIDPSAA